MKEQRSLRGKFWVEPEFKESKQALQKEVFIQRVGEHEAEIWSAPQWHDLSDPFLMRDMPLAVKRIQQAITGQERIMVYGDFDADGITSTVALVHGLQALGALVSYRIPDRVNDSHGLKKELIDEIAATGSKLIITVDCGVNDRAEVQYATELGLEVLITDHHKVDPDRWAHNAIAVVNPAHPDCNYPTSKLAGVGVVFKVLQALNNDPHWLEPYLALVAIGTVADCVSLSEESRSLVQLGLVALNKNYWPGVTALLDIDTFIEAETIGFQLAPCLNAASRLGEVQHAVQLFLGDLNHTADRVAYLKQLNEERRTLSQQYSAEAEALVQAGQSVQIIYLETCPVGVLGLVASRLVERLAQPILVLTRHPHGALHGSARAPKPLNLAAALESTAEFLTGFGGHAGAAGFQLEEAQLASFMTAMQTFFSQQEAPTLTLNCDGLVESEWLSLEWRQWEKSLEPFGMGNHKPVWCVRQLKLKAVEKLGRTGQHARFKFSDNQEAVAFFCSDLLPQLEVGNTYDVAVSVNENTWRGETKVQWHLVDMRG
jgi:single-stranded-DNA-specific exonuclease